MDMNTRNQYLKVLQEKYFMASVRKEKSSILVSIAVILTRIGSMSRGR